VRRKLVIVAAAAVFVLLAIQLVPVARTNPPIGSELSSPADVAAVLARACGDCHSNRTRWPWYSHVAPVSWIVAHDVAEAREHFNLSTWGSLEPKKQLRLREEMWEEVAKGDMPLLMYRLAHREAHLSEADRELLRRWAEQAERRD